MRIESIVRKRKFSKLTPLKRVFASWEGANKLKIFIKFTLVLFKLLAEAHTGMLLLSQSLVSCV